MNIPPTIKTIPLPFCAANHAAAAPHLQTVEPPPCAIQATAPLEEAESHRQRRQKPPLSYCQPHQEGHKHGAIHLCCADQILAECAPPEQWRLNFSLTHLSQVGSPGTLPHGRKCHQNRAWQISLTHLSQSGPSGTHSWQQSAQTLHVLLGWHSLAGGGGGEGGGEGGGGGDGGHMQEF
mgnify:CR=1 FL=1